ncbi:MAG: alpha-galactosidase [Armatimonadota bacterium]|nr:alpha-galactosidase [Armatimonadota bacterium]
MRHLATFILFAASAILILSISAASAKENKPGTGFGIHTQDITMRFGKVNGEPVITSISANGSYKWLGQSPETALPHTATVNGKETPLKWKPSGGMHLAVRAGIALVRFTYECSDLHLVLKSAWFTVPKFPGPIEHSVTIENKGSETVIFAPSPTIALTLRPRNGHSLEHWWIEKTSGHVGDPGTHTDAMQPGYQKALNCGPYSLSEVKRDELPWFCIHDATGKFGLYGGIEFSGWTRTSVGMANDKSVSVSMGLNPWDGGSRSAIKPGETLSYPTCFIGAYKGEVDDGCNQLHRWVEKHLRPAIPYGVTPVLVNNSWGSGMAVDEALAKRMIDDCADLGIEIYHVDAGWYKAVGDWRSNPEKFPNGLEKTVDYVHSKGMKFGLWVGWTQGGHQKNAGPESLNVFTPSQRSWFGHDTPDDWHTGPFTGETVCLGCADARAWCLNDLRRMVKEFKLDLLEHDQTMVRDSCGREGHGHIPNDRTDVSRACAEGYYQIYDQLRSENPKLLFEDCVNGGRFFDFGVAKRNHYMCMTDDYDPVNLRKCFYDASYPFPPSMLESYIADHRGQTLASFRYMLRSAMMGWCTIMMDTSKWTPEQREAGKREFKMYKERLRPLIASANIYHVLPRPDGKQWDGIQYADPKTGNGVLFVFRPQSDQESQAVILRGLNPKKRYAIDAADGSASGTYSGAELMQSGLMVRLAEKNSSDLVFFGTVR